jgi:hypothetical protein
MLRKLCCIALCVMVVAAGCGKKEESEPISRKKPPKEPPEPKMEAPEGFARIGEELFVTRRPPRIEEYVTYLEATGQDLPDRFRSPEVNYQDPVTGLAKEEAADFATWKMLRLPTREEWAEADRIVGSVPYPWNGTTASDAPLYLVRDWTEGSEAQQQARRAREELHSELLSKRRAEVEKGLNMLNGLTESRSEELKKQWQQFKTALSELIEQQKQHARQVAATRGRQVVLEVMKHVGQEKKKIIHAKFDEEAAPEKVQTAKDNYQQFLEKQRNDVQALKEQVIATNQDLSQKARRMMDELEQKGQNLTRRPGKVANRRKADPTKIQSMEKLADLRNQLQDSISTARATATETQKAFQTATQKVNERTTNLENAIEKLPEEEKTSQKIQELQQKIQNLNQDLDEQFVQEPHLFKELTEYTELAATKQALEQEVATLERMLKILQLPELPAEASPDSPTEAAPRDGDN